MYNGKSISNRYFMVSGHFTNAPNSSHHSHSHSCHRYHTVALLYLSVPPLCMNDVAIPPINCHRHDTFKTISPKIWNFWLFPSYWLIQSIIGKKLVHSGVSIGLREKSDLLKVVAQNRCARGLHSIVIDMDQCIGGRDATPVSGDVIHLWRYDIILLYILGKVWKLDNGVWCMKRETRTQEYIDTDTNTRVARSSLQ